MSATVSRRALLAGFGSVLLRSHLCAASGKPMRGIFIIMSTPYTSSKAVDFEDLANEVEFLDRCAVHGMVWPQLASEYFKLTTEERMHGMEVLARTAKKKRAALVLGVQAPNVEGALAYARHAEKLEPDAMIAIPPSEAKTLDDFRNYYRALAQATDRPLFIQTTGGAKGITPETSFLLQLAREFPNVGYVKEEFQPVIPRMKQLSSNRPAVKSVFSGGGGHGMMYEMRLGFDGTMPGAPYADVYTQIWDLYQSAQQAKARDLFSKLLLILECEQQIPGTRQYIMRKRGVFKTVISRQHEFDLDAKAIEEIEFNFAALEPYLRATNTREPASKATTSKN